MSDGGLPPVLAITPLAAPPDAVVRLPGSKSITNRALVVAALAEGRSTLEGVLFSDDTEAMLGCLDALGVEVFVDRTSHTVVVEGTGGRIPAVGATLDARQSGTTARFVAPLVALGHGRFLLDGAPQLRARPMADLLDALEQLAVPVAPEPGSRPGALPFTVHAAGVVGGSVRIAGDVSSQFLSGLMLVAPAFDHGLRVQLTTPLVSQPYVAMTAAVMRAFGATVRFEDDGAFGTYVVEPARYAARHYVIEPDASAASYFFAAAAITGGRVVVPGLGTGALQGDVAFVDVLERMGATVVRTADAIEVVGTGLLHGVEADFSAISDTAQTLAAVAPFADSPTRVTGIGFIRRKETNRIAAVVRELQRCGILVEELDDGFVVHPGEPRPARVETYDDHRMAMSFALLGLRVPGIEIADPGCVAKTFPDYFAVLETLRRTPVDAVPDVPVVAIDGPAGSGKSTVARGVARALGTGYLDTGAMYRAVTWAAQHRGLVDDEAALASLARSIELVVSDDPVAPQVVTVDGTDVTAAIRGPEVTAGVSVVASVPAVRAALVERQRRWAAEGGGGVLEGRDIASVVFPAAPVKVYLTASDEERARRRHAELTGEAAPSVEAVAADLARRDHVDSNRAADPLRRADGAVVVDSTGRTAAEVIAEVIAMAEAAGLAPAPAPAASSAETAAPADTAAPVQALAQDAAAPTAEAPTPSLPPLPVRPPLPAPSPTLPLGTRVVYRIARDAVVGFARVFFRTTYEGLQNVPRDGAFILSPVHRSNVDTFVAAGVTRRRMRFLGKDSMWKVKAFGKLFDALGGIKVHRGTPDREAMRLCIDALENGEPVVVFPEGTRRTGPVVEETFEGAAFMAVKAGVPIVPVGIGGSERAMARHHRLPRPVRIHVVVGAPLYPSVASGGRGSRRAVHELNERLKGELQRLFDVARRRVGA